VKRKIFYPLMILFVVLIVFSVQGSVLSLPQRGETDPPGQDSDPPQTSVKSSDPVGPAPQIYEALSPLDDMPATEGVNKNDPPELSAQAEGSFVTSAPTFSSTHVLWDQYANWSGGDYASQDFGAGWETFDAFAADDFMNISPWLIDTIVTRGGWSYFVDLNFANSLQWWICPDNGGEPLCTPPYDGSAVWSISLVPSDPQVMLGLYEPEDVVLSLNTPISLPPGHWWLVYQASIDYDTYGQYGWSATTDPGWGAPALQNNPGGAFGMGTGWFPTWYYEDFMFRLEGSYYLWDQYLYPSGIYYAAQDFEPSYDPYDIFAADDFANLLPWKVDTIVTRGDWGSYVDLNNATSLQWWICPDFGGVPLCDPPYDGNAVWAISLPPTNPQVQLGVFEAEDVYLTLDDPIELPPGNWWLVYQVSLDLIPNGQYGWSGTSSLPVWGSPGMQINPNGGFGYGLG